MKNILVFMPQWVGDTVMSVPSLILLKKSLGNETKITLLVQNHLIPVIDHLPYFHKVIGYKKKEMKSLGGLLSLSRNIKKENFEAVILFSNSFRSALFCYLSGIPLRFGYKSDFRN
ncbi:MAG: glycosyltransferase family 9 protein, partial [Nitrospinae bacterium]|nr:glycosyltransferase family 9 protein [Nitrospinota bacterium]